MFGIGDGTDFLARQHGNGKKGTCGSRNTTSLTRREVGSVDDLTLQSAEHRLYGVRGRGHPALRYLAELTKGFKTDIGRFLSRPMSLTCRSRPGGARLTGGAPKCQPLRQPAHSHEGRLVHRECHMSTHKMHFRSKTQSLLVRRSRCQISRNWSPAENWEDEPSYIPLEWRRAQRGLGILLTHVTGLYGVRSA